LPRGLGHGRAPCGSRIDQSFPAGAYKHYKSRPERFRVANADGSVTEYKVKQKHGRTEVKIKGKKKRKWR
jgi:hypothetical protein